jgi:hypothetical protein
MRKAVHSQNVRFWPIVLQKSFCVLDHKISSHRRVFHVRMWGALNSSVTSVICLESPLLAVLACLGSSRKNHCSAFSDFCNLSARRRPIVMSAIWSLSGSDIGCALRQLLWCPFQPLSKHSFELLRCRLLSLGRTCSGVSSSRFSAVQ